MRRCARREATYLAAVDDALTPAQLDHARGCTDCTRAVTSGASFLREPDAAVGSLTGPPLPPAVLNRAAPRSPWRPAGVAATVVAGFLLVAAGLVLGRSVMQRGTLTDPDASTHPTLHVLVSNHQRAALTVTIETTIGDGPMRVTFVVPGCGGGYVTAPLGERWVVRSGDLTAALGPPAAVSGDRDDVTVRIAQGAGGADVFPGSPRDNGLDAAAIAAASVAPCR